MNPLTAQHNISNGQLLEPRFVDAVAQLSDEVYQVISNLDASDAESKESFRRRLQQVIELTAANHSSMQQDLAHGRKTEIDYITGFILEHANGIPVPVSQQLYNEIKSREA